MLGEVLLAGMFSVIPVSHHANATRKYEIQTAIFSSRGYENFIPEELYFPEEGNKLLQMESKTSTQKNFNNNSDKLLTAFKCLISDLRIGFDEEIDYFDFLFNLSEEEDYNSFLWQANLDGNLKVCSAISIFLSQKDYSAITAQEENFIIAMLKSGNVQIQSIALTAILNWDEVSDINYLKSIKIDNDFLQEDLTEFIEHKA